MYQQPPRRKARAIAISETIESRRKTVMMRAMALLGLGLGIADVVWTVHHVLIAR
jgi:hypothetical protein